MDKFLIFVSAAISTILSYCISMGGSVLAALVVFYIKGLSITPWTFILALFIYCFVMSFKRYYRLVEEVSIQMEEENGD